MNYDSERAADRLRLENQSLRGALLMASAIATLMGCMTLYLLIEGVTR